MSDERMPVAGRDDPAADSDRGANSAPPNDMPLSDAQAAGVMEFVNNAEIQQAQLARSKSKNPEVKSLATMIIEHHTQAKEQQARLGLSTTSSPLLQTLSSEGQRTLSKLRDERGRDFDRAYVQAQIDQHQKVLDTIDRQLLPNRQNAQLRSHVQNLRPTIQQHLQAARNALTAIENGRSEHGSSGHDTGGSSSSNPSGTSGQQRR